MFFGLIALFGRVLFFTGYINNKSSFEKPLGEADELKYLTLIQNEKCKIARDKLVTHNMRLVAHIVKKYSNVNLETDDLISIGSIGLIKAIDAFKLEKNTAFATFAARCIENEIRMQLRSGKKFALDTSINESIGIDKDGNEITLLDILAHKGKSVPCHVEALELSEKIMGLIKGGLSKREQEIVIQRYGLNGNVPQTQNEVAKKQSISRSYISRIEKKALTKIREHLQKEEYKP
ncbi:MAG: RNA polymerase sporulation sigma factor SigK [Firmicutes bacterium]|nr:RNA polymerase sporulation sigma factor SigK [Bacillota bacterium]